MKKRKEEILELAWVGREKDSFTRADVEKSNDERISVELVDELIAEGYLTQIRPEGGLTVPPEGEVGGQVALTDSGEKEARRLIRSHRLSERLFTDVLDITAQSMEKHACTFEHFLSDEVVDSICTLLGHPRECPHGRAIPPGSCCEKALKKIAPIVAPLNEFKVGSEVRIAYVATKNHQRLDQLASFGILPGAMVHIHQIKPSYVLKIGETNIALDDTIVKDIYARMSGS